MAEVPEGAAAPVVPASEVVKDQPAPAAEDQKAEGEVSDTPVETTEQQEAKKQSKFQRRLDRQKTARIAAETETRLLREQIAKHEAQSKQQQGSDEPKREQFEDYEAYLRAVARYDAKQELKSDREARESKEQQGRQREVSEKVAKNWTERETAFQAANKDYATLVEDFVQEDLASLSREARHAIVESEVGPALLFHLASHPDVAERIADLSPTRQIVELGKLEDKLPVAKKTTSAPAPITPVSGGKTSSKDLTKMSQKEYEAHRKAQGARWAQ